MKRPPAALTHLTQKPEKSSVRRAAAAADAPRAGRGIQNQKQPHRLQIQEMIRQPMRLPINLPKPYRM
jgi:hypothetical protein